MAGPTREEDPSESWSRVSQIANLETRGADPNLPANRPSDRRLCARTSRAGAVANAIVRGAGRDGTLNSAAARRPRDRDERVGQ